MPYDVTIALQITAIGMGLVFGAILLLWALMAVLVRLAPEKGREPEGEVPAEGPGVETALKQQAAAAAVALALAEQDSGAIQEFPLPQTAIVSAWQLASRTKTLNRRGATR